MTPLLEVRGARVEFEGPRGNTVAVGGVDLSVGEGEIVALLGESGSGKTVLTLSLLQLVMPPGRVTAGTALFQGRDLYGLNGPSMRRVRGNDIAMVSQEPMTALNPLRTVGVQIAEAVRLHARLGRAAARDRSVELLELVGLPDPARQARQYPHTLSGGMRQRVVIAMAMACRPRLLLADEPTTALDVTVQKQILDLLVGLAATSDMALLLVTHDLAVAAQYAHRVVVMRHGMVVEQGTTAQVFARPQHEYTRALLAAVPGQGPRLVRAPVVPAGTGGSPPVLEVRGLSKHFVSRHGTKRTTVRAVDGVDFTIGPGSTLGLVGESGSGKSTTARLISRLVTPTSGSVRLNGVELTVLDGAKLRAERRNVQLVFQDPFASLDPTHNVGSIVAEPLRAHAVGNRSEQADRVAELLRRVRLSPDHARRSPHELSGGQRQRVAIARALALEPRLVICDEAVSSLDVSVQKQVLDLLGELQREFGLAYLFISHDLAVVREISDHVAVMHEGRVVEQGSVERVYEAPEHAYTRLLLASAPPPPHYAPAVPAG